MFIVSQEPNTHPADNGAGNKKETRTALVMQRIQRLDRIIRHDPILLLPPEKRERPVVRVHLPPQVRAERALLRVRGRPG